MEDLTRDLEHRRTEVTRNLANKGGQGASFAIFSSVGQGAFEFEEGVDFVLAFQEEPFMAYGAYCNADDLLDLLEMDDDETPPFPLTTGYVTEWVMDDNDFYVGAFVAVRVHFPSDIPVSSDIDVALRHYFKFEAIGLKGISA